MGRLRGSFVARTAVGLISFTVAAAAAEPSMRDESVRVRLSRGAQNHLLLAGSVNGHAATFLIDTGADISFLRADRSKEFGVRPVLPSGRSSGGRFEFGQVDDVRAGSVRLGTGTFALYHPAQFRGHVPGSSGKPADGVLGLDILRRQNAVVHCRPREIVFHANRAEAAKLVGAARAGGFTQIPMTATRRGHPTVPCTINGRKGRLLVDTGAFVTGLDDDAARSLGLDRRPSRLTTRGFDGRVRSLELAPVEDMRIGGLRIAPQPLAVIDLFPKKRRLRAISGLGRIEYYAALQVPREGPIFGLLGNELLDQRHAIIDLATMSLFLK